MAGAAAYADRQFRGRLGRARSALENPARCRRAIRNSPQPMWLGRESIEGKTILIACRRRAGRHDPVCALRADGGGARRARHPGRSGCAVSAAVGTTGRLAMHSETGGCAAGVRHALPDRAACRWPSERGSIPFRPRCRICRRPPEARVQAWEDRLGPHDRLRVGLVWSGNPEHKATITTVRSRCGC